jgi:tryptophan synthase alpha chain
MHNISRILAARKAFIPYLTAGDPNLQTTLAAMKALADSGADIIELGIPFNDPVADGPTIQKASERALRNPFSMLEIFETVAAFRKSGYETGVLLMTYANPVFQFGYESFCQTAKAHGVDAALITDLPPEEATDYIAAARDAGLGTVFLCSPTTTPERLAMIDSAATAFVYYVAHAGVTGVRDSLPDDLLPRIEAIASAIKNPLCVGFGVSKPEQAAAIASRAAGVIVGSAVVKHFENHAGDALLDALGHFAREMKEAIHV